MKKLYTLLMGICIAGASMAQTNDLTVALEFFSDGDASSDDPLVLDFSITNNGSTIATGDSVFWTLAIGTDYYSTIDLDGPGSVVYTELTADMVNGDSFTIDCADIPMDWAYDALGGLNGDICIAVLGVGTASISSVWDDNPSDNVSCVDYTVTEVASIGEDLTSSIGNVYVADDQLRIETNLDSYVDNANVTITNISGQVVQNENNISLANGVNNITLNETTTGMYLVTITANGESTTKKVVIR